MIQGEAAFRVDAYPERLEMREALGDRLISTIGFGLQRAFGRGPRNADELVRTVRSHARRFSAGALVPRVAELRYQLRKQGMRGAVVCEALALYAAACADDGEAPEAVLAAARSMLRGRVADLPDTGGRRQAAAFAAAAFAIAGTPVHLIAASEVLARRAAQAMRDPMAALGFEVACIEAGMDQVSRHQSYRADVVCGSQREFAHDYLRDRLLLGVRKHPMHFSLARISGEAPAEERLMLRGLQCAVVEDADLVLIDDARTPLIISAESDHSQERLLYEQAIELARALGEGSDFLFEDGDVRLTAAGSGRLARLVRPLGGIWSGQERREELIVGALVALHCEQRDRDYQVIHDRLVFPDPAGERQGEPEPAGSSRQRLLEVKEGLKFAGSRDILARISVARFFSRYLHLCGVCHDAGGLEWELWSTYRLQTERVAAARPMPSFRSRIFATERDKLDALVQAAAAPVQEPLAISLRSQSAVAALSEAFASEGAQLALLRGADDDQERAAAANLHRPGAVTLLLPPAERNAAFAPSIVRCVRLIAADLHDSTRQLALLQRTFPVHELEVWLSLEEEAVAVHLGFVGELVAAAFGDRSGEASPGWAAWLFRRVQRGIGNRNRALRQEVAAADQQMSDLLAFSGARD